MILVMEKVTIVADDDDAIFFNKRIFSIKDSASWLALTTIDKENVDGPNHFLLRRSMNKS